MVTIDIDSKAKYKQELKQALDNSIINRSDAFKIRTNQDNQVVINDTVTGYSARIELEHDKNNRYNWRLFITDIGYPSQQPLSRIGAPLEHALFSTAISYETGNRTAAIHGNETRLMPLTYSRGFTVKEKIPSGTLLSGTGIFDGVTLFCNDELDILNHDNNESYLGIQHPDEDGVWRLDRTYGNQSRLENGYKLNINHATNPDAISDPQLKAKISAHLV